MDFKDCMVEKDEKNLLVVIDNFEEKIKLIDELTKEYNKLKKQIKDAMVDLGRTNNLDQVKWTTPKGIKITCSIGKQAEMEKQIIKEFNEDILKEKYPDIYNECFEEKEKLVILKNETNDRLVITLPKES